MVTRYTSCTLWDKFLEKLAVSQPVKKFSVSYGTRSSIIVFSRVPRFFLSRILSTLSIMFCKFHFHIIVSLILSSKWSPSFRYPHQTHISISPFPLTYHFPRQSHPELSLLLHRAFWRFTEYYTPTNAQVILYISLKFIILKQLKCSSMFRSLDHPHGARIVPCWSYMEHFKCFGD
jgi:hypothetical protein